MNQFSETPNEKNKAEYYITATSNNGKTTVNPISAPGGYFTAQTLVNSVDNFDQNWFSVGPLHWNHIDTFLSQVKI